MKGIDISHWQSGFPLSKLKDSEYSFVIIKAGGTEAGYQYEDTCFKDFAVTAVNAGLDIGAYYYSTAKSAEAAIIESDHFISILESVAISFTMPVYVDIEDKQVLQLGKKCSEIAAAFVLNMESHGYCSGVYASAAVWKNQLAYCTVGERWVAHWTKNRPYCSGIHQYTNSEHVLGYKVDGNLCYTDYPHVLLERGYNGLCSACDINKDGKIDSKDLVQAMKAIATNKQDSKYDVNKDNKINSKDLTHLMKEVSK